MSNSADPISRVSPARTPGTLGLRDARSPVSAGQSGHAPGVIAAPARSSQLRYLALHDRRLQGGVPARPRLYIVNTDGSTPLAAAFREINSTVRWAGRIHTMFILCHGYAGENTRAQMSMDAGGMGLELGREDVLHTNVGRWIAIRGRVDNIVVYSCAAANTERGNEATEADGKYLMGALAIHTNANVFAADRIQWYGTWQNKATGAFDWGAWEGKLWYFPPSGVPPTRVLGRAPVEFSDVLTGSAP
jgi:hypothetical protein